MARRYGQHSQEQLEQLRDYYIQNPISLADLASISHDLFGIRISVEELRFYGNNERWGVLKQRAAHGKQGVPESVAEEIQDLREQVFDTIMNPEDRPSPRDLSSLITAYMNLQSASGARVGSAKTSMQEVLDAAERIIHGRTDDTDA